MSDYGTFCPCRVDKQNVRLRERTFLLEAEASADFRGSQRETDAHSIMCISEGAFLFQFVHQVAMLTTLTTASGVRLASGRAANRKWPRGRKSRLLRGRRGWQIMLNHICS